MIKYKKFSALFFTVCLVVILLVGCSNQQSTIGPAELTASQQEVINLLSLSQGQEILVFDFQAVETYKNMEFWVAVYEYGVLVDNIPAGLAMQSDEGSLFEGQLVITIDHDHDGNFSWRFVITCKSGARSSSHGNSQVTSATTPNRSFGPILEPVIIQEDTDFILYISKFSQGGFGVDVDHQIFLEQPQLLERYPYVHIIKGRFSNDNPTWEDDDEVY